MNRGSKEDGSKHNLGDYNSELPALFKWLPSAVILGFYYNAGNRSTKCCQLRTGGIQQRREKARVI